jgi:methyl-accepting chemotaxis protein
MIADITAGTEEQTSGIEQVNTAIAQMDEMTQQNAALVEEASASSEAVSEQALGLAKMMEFFTVGGNSGRDVGGSFSNYAPPVGSSGGSSAAVDMYNKPSDDSNDWKDF